MSVLVTLHPLLLKPTTQATARQAQRPRESGGARMNLSLCAPAGLSAPLRKSWWTYDECLAYPPPPAQDLRERKALPILENSCMHSRPTPRRVAHRDAPHAFPASARP